MKYLYLTLILLSCERGFTQETTSQEYQEDFRFFWNSIKENYCYWDKKQTDWDKVMELYGKSVDTVSSKRNFVLLLEKVLNELYDHHASLNTNTKESQRLVPSGTDIWAAYQKDKPVITAVRSGFGAALCGLKPGMEIIAVNDIPIEMALESFKPFSLIKYNKVARDYILRILLAGKAVDNRKITVKDGNNIQDFYPDQPKNLLREHNYESDIESKKFTNGIGYIKINNQLGNNNLIKVFDSVLQSLKDTRALILDLRETPSGGNTTVARAILGSFIKKEGFYQKHEFTAEERMYGVKRSWMEIVSPRKYVYTKPLVVLVNYWTGSVGEGIAIGFDALKRATIIGTPMAGLNGANYSYQMPNTKIGFSFPVEKLFHVNGIAREDFKPVMNIDLKKEKAGEDLTLTSSINFLLTEIKKF